MTEREVMQLRGGTEQDHGPVVKRTTENTS